MVRITWLEDWPLLETHFYSAEQFGHYAKMRSQTWAIDKLTSVAAYHGATLGTDITKVQQLLQEQIGGAY